jgi:hypothetical protein
MKCQFEKCCDSVDAVFNDAGPTMDLANCWLDCTTPECEVACYEKYADGIVGFGGYEACVAVNCTAVGMCKSSSQCLICQYTQCPQELANCKTNEDCASIYPCLGTCATGDTACGKACVTKHPGGAQLYDLLGVCTAQNCIDMCGK